MSKKQILVVDDVAISLAAIESAIKDKYEVMTMNSGARALRYLEREKPDLILLDIHMAHKDGIETLREIRKMKGGEEIPVIMLTSAQDRKMVIEAQKLGIYDYVLKPFNPEELRTRIQRALELAQSGGKKA